MSTRTREHTYVCARAHARACAHARTHASAHARTRPGRSSGCEEISRSGSCNPRVWVEGEGGEEVFGEVVWERVSREEGSRWEVEGGRGGDGSGEEWARERGRGFGGRVSRERGFCKGTRVFFQRNEGFFSTVRRREFSREDGEVFKGTRGFKREGERVYKGERVRRVFQKGGRVFQGEERGGREYVSKRGRKRSSFRGREEGVGKGRKSVFHGEEERDFL